MDAAPLVCTVGWACGSGGMEVPALVSGAGLVYSVAAPVACEYAAEFAGCLVCSNAFTAGEMVDPVLDPPGAALSPSLTPATTGAPLQTCKTGRLHKERSVKRDTIVVR